VGFGGGVGVVQVDSLGAGRRDPVDQQLMVVASKAQQPRCDRPRTETGTSPLLLEAVLDHRSLLLTVAYPYVVVLVCAPPRLLAGETGF